MTVTVAALTIAIATTRGRIILKAPVVINPKNSPVFGAPGDVVAVAVVAVDSVEQVL